MNIMQEALTVPDIEKCKRLLCIQPHPDDNEVGAGAVIAKLAENGCEVYYLTVTDGSLGTSDVSVSINQLIDIRKKEQQAAAALLGVKGMYSLGLRDKTTLNVSEISSKLVGIIREVKPDMIMTVDPWAPYEGHPDHYKTGFAAVDAFLSAGNPRFPYVDDDTIHPTWDVVGIAFYFTAYPNTFVDVSKYFDKKMEAIKKHQSQFTPEVIKMYEMYFKAKGMQLAEGRGFEIAEGLKVMSGLHLHCFPDAIHL